MKRVLLIIACISLLFFQTCSSPMQSSIFTSTSQSINTNGNQLTSAKIEKFGKSCSMSGFLVDFFFYGSGGSIEEAKANGGITKVATVDYTSLNILFSFFYRECIVVWGE